MDTARPSRRSPWGALLPVVAAALLLALATGWASRPVSSPDARSHRLLPAVAGHPRTATDPVPTGDPSGRDRAVGARAGDGASVASWDTSRGYPVAVSASRTAGRTAGRGTAASAPYSWLVVRDPGGPPARWSPCAPIVVRVNPAGFDAADLADVRWATSAVQRSTGIEVRLGGATSETVEGSLGRRDWVDGTWSTDSHRRWAPVLLLGSDAARTPELAGATTGWTHVHTDPAGTHLVSGVVAIDLEGLARDRRAGGLRLLLLHELGHLVGLGHVDDPDLVMHPYAVPAPGETPGYREGDRTGLAAAGRGPC